MGGGGSSGILILVIIGLVALAIVGLVIFFVLRSSGPRHHPGYGQPPYPPQHHIYPPQGPQQGAPQHGYPPQYPPPLGPPPAPGGY